MADTAISYLHSTLLIGREEVEEFFAHHFDIQNVAVRVLKEFPFLAKQRNDFMKCLQAGNMLTLHFAVMHKAPIHVLEEIIECCPQLLETTGYDGETPLHIACRSDDVPRRLFGSS